MTSRPRSCPLARIAVVGVAAVLIVAGCSNDGGGGGGTVATFTSDDAPDRGEVIAGIVDDVIMPAYEELVVTTEALADETSKICGEYRVEQLYVAQDAWRDAQSAWASTEAFRFGPAKDLKSNSDIAYEVDLEKLETSLATPGELPEVIGLEVVADLGADVRGLAAVEHLVFGDQIYDPRRCAYAAAATQLIADGAVELRDAWTVGVDGDEPFAEQMRSPGGDSMYADQIEVLADLVNGSISALTSAADMYLGPASGADGAEPAPASVDVGAAHQAGDDVADMIASVRAVYTGDGSTDGATADDSPTDDSPTNDTAGNEATAAGLGALVAAQSPSTDLRMAGDLTDAAEQLAIVTTPWADLVLGDEAQASQFEALSEAYDNVVAARVTMRTEIASQLGVTVSFSDSDGDG